MKFGLRLYSKGDVVINHEKPGVIVRKGHAVVAPPGVVHEGWFFLPDSRYAKIDPVWDLDRAKDWMDANG